MDDLGLLIHGGAALLAATKQSRGLILALVTEVTRTQTLSIQLLPSAEANPIAVPCTLIWRYCVTQNKEER